MNSFHDSGILVTTDVTDKCIPNIRDIRVIRGSIYFAFESVHRVNEHAAISKSHELNPIRQGGA